MACVCVVVCVELTRAGYLWSSPEMGVIDDCGTHGDAPFFLRKGIFSAVYCTKCTYVRLNPKSE